ncbi:MAG: multicopper oxidase type 3 [Gammaproteobacteria bacterium]|nr:multicopper oxidase type 3 [Gammaproteobacteria bacterium]
MKKSADLTSFNLHIQLLAGCMLLSAVLLCCPAIGAVPGITGPTFKLKAGADLVTQPDGAMIYSWGYGCNGGPAGYLPPSGSGAGPKANCPSMQLPGPTLIVTEGDDVTVELTNGLPTAAGNTSIVFSGLAATAADGVSGPLVKEAAHGGKVTYTFHADKPGTYAYYSGSHPDLQIEMGLFGTVIVRPSPNYSAPVTCRQGDFALAPTAYDNDATCYDREYLFQFSEINSRVHQEAQALVAACGEATDCPPMNVSMEPYRPSYFLVNGRSMPDLMDTPYAAAYPHQPYNGNPHMHPGERVLMRVVGQGRWQHPFHFHGNHARVLARDGNLIVSQGTSGTTAPLAGPLLFTIPTVSGQSVDAIFSWTGQGLNWDVYGSQVHSCNSVDEPKARAAQASADATVLAQLAGNGGFDKDTHEYCPDHGKPFPVAPPDPQIVANGQWYGGTPYLGLSGFKVTDLAPGTLQQNPSAGYAYMWHSHNEREITTNDVFPGGMMMMLIIDPPVTPDNSAATIDETL